MSAGSKAVKVTFTPVAVPPGCRPSLPRSGACAAPLPAWHADEAIMIGGYTEDRSGSSSSGGGAGAGVAATHGSAAATPSPPVRGPTIEAWTFSSAEGGRWRRVQYAEGSPMPQPRLTCQAAVVGSELWLVGGWDPSAPAPPPGEQPPPGSPAQFLNDVWALDLRTYRWRRVAVAGEEVPRISRFAMAALHGRRLLLHTHRCDEHVLLLDTAAEGAAAPEAAAAAEGAAAAAAEERPQQPTLSRVPVRGVFPGDQSPASRGLHSMTAAAAPPTQPPPLEEAAEAGPVGPAEPGTALYVYGGAPQSGPMYGDLWALDTATMAWQQLEPAGAKPQARCSHVAAACGPGGRYLLVIGGSFYAQPGRLQPLDDVVLYDTKNNRWVEPEVDGPRPSARNAAVLVPLRRSGDGDSGSGSGVEGAGAGADGGATQRFLYHGGWRPFMETYDDSYVVTVTAA